MNIDNVINYLKSYNNKDIKLMEICGTHTASIAENAIQSIISDKIHLISGPGCPVCVTVSSYVDRLCELSKYEIPESLAALKNKEIRFKESIESADMKDFVLRSLSL